MILSYSIIFALLLNCVSIRSVTLLFPHLVFSSLLNPINPLLSFHTLLMSILKTLNQLVCEFLLSFKTVCYFNFVWSDCLHFVGCILFVNEQN